MEFFSTKYNLSSAIHYNPFSLTTNSIVYPTILTACIPFVFVVSAYLFLIRTAQTRRQKAKLPRYDAIPSSQVKHIASPQVLRDLSGKIDVAIVGSGIGALSNAAALARQGYKVAVFEQNETVGGCTHTFEKEGYEFDVGVHYVGGFSPMIKRMYEQLSDGQLKWTKLDRAYDVMYNGTTGERIEMTDDHAENRRVLTEHFDIDAKSWKLFDKACFWAKIWSFVVFQLKLWHPIVLFFAWPFVALPYRRYALRSTTDVLLKDCGFSNEAAGALTYHWGDHGVPPHRCPMFLTALLDTHYKGGGYFPRGGSRSIAKCLVAAIERRGGHVFALSPVQEILTKKSVLGRYTSVGVRVRGIDVFAKKVVSDAGFLATFGGSNDGEGLVKSKAGAAQRALMHTTKGADAATPCISDLSLFIGLNRSDGDLKLPAQNIWHVHSWDHDTNWKQMTNDTTPEDCTAERTPFLFISNESAKDPDFATSHPYKATSEVFAVCKFDLFEKWASTTHNSRDRDYLAFKEKLTENFLNAFYLHFPQAKGHVVFTSLGTPLTMNKFLGRKHGEVYALDHDIARFDGWRIQRALHPQTCVKNLLLTGEDAFMVSVTACMISGHITAARTTWDNWFGLFPILFRGLPEIFFS